MFWITFDTEDSYWLSVIRPLFRSSLRSRNLSSMFISFLVSVTRPDFMPSLSLSQSFLIDNRSIASTSPLSRSTSAFWSPPGIKISAGQNRTRPTPVTIASFWAVSSCFRNTAWARELIRLSSSRSWEQFSELYWWYIRCGYLRGFIWTGYQ